MTPFPASTSVLYDSFFNFGTEDILGPVGQVEIAGFSPVGVDVFNFPQQRVNNTYQLADNLTFRTGNHSFTFGVDFRRTELHSDLPRNARPLLVFNGAPGAQRVGGSVQLTGFVRPVDLAAASAPSGVLQVVQTSPDSRIDLRYYQYNYFGQDDWRVRPNVSLSLGLRYEYNSPVEETQRRIEKTFNDPSLEPGAGLAEFPRRQAADLRPRPKQLWTAGRTGLFNAPVGAGSRVGFSRRLWDFLRSSARRGGESIAQRLPKFSYPELCRGAAELSWRRPNAKASASTFLIRRCLFSPARTQMARASCRSFNQAL